jgi:hypothetical protein
MPIMKIRGSAIFTFTILKLPIILKVLFLALVQVHCKTIRRKDWKEYARAKLIISSGFSQDGILRLVRASSFDSFRGVANIK